MTTRRVVSAVATLAALLCLAAAPSDAAFAEVYQKGVLGGELYTTGTYRCGTFAATLKTGTCSGVQAGMGLLLRSSTTQSDISFYYSQKDAAFTAVMESTVMETKVSTIVHKVLGWAAVDVTRYVTLSITMAANTLTFHVDGVPLTTKVPVTGTASAGSPVSFTVVSPTSLCNQPRHFYIFSGAGGGRADSQAPSVACLPQYALFGPVRYTAAAGMGSSFVQASWTANDISGASRRWNVGTAVTARLTKERSQWGSVAATATSLEAGATGKLQVSVALASFAPISAAQDEDPDLIDPNWSEDNWRVSSDAQSTVSARRTVQRDGRIAFRVVSTGVADRASIAIEKHVTNLPAATLLCSVARVFTELPRHVSMSTTDALDAHRSKDLLINAGSWQMFNTCYVHGAATPKMSAIALLGRYDTRVEFHPHNIYLDFLYTVSVGQETQEVAWEGGPTLLQSWYVTATPTPVKVPQYPWVPAGAAWEVTVVDNVGTTNPGKLKAVAKSAGEGSIKYYSLVLQHGETYRVKMTATTTSAAPKTIIYASVHTTTNVPGGVNQIVFENGVERTYEWVFTAYLPTGVLRTDGTLAFTFFVAGAPAFSKFAVNDEILISAVTMEAWLPATMPDVQNLDINPTEADRNNDVNEAGLLWKHIPVYRNGPPTPPPATPLPTVLTPLEEAYDGRFGQEIILLTLDGTQGVPEVLNITALRRSLGGMLARALKQPSASDENIKVLKVCRGTYQGRIEMVNSTTLQERLPRDEKEMCRSTVASPGSWFLHLEHNGTLHVHMMLVGLAPDVNTFHASQAFANEVEQRIIETGQIGTLEVSTTSSIRLYLPEIIEITPSPPFVREEGERRSDLSNVAWALIIVATFFLCALVGAIIANVMVRYRPDLDFSDSEVSSNDLDDERGMERHGLRSTKNVYDDTEPYAWPGDEVAPARTPRLDASVVSPVGGMSEVKKAADQTPGNEA